MTREKAINLVMKVFDTLEGECNIEYDWREEHEARDMAIEALRQQDRILQILDDCDLEAWEILEKIKEVVRVNVTSVS